MSKSAASGRDAAEIPLAVNLGAEHTYLAVVRQRSTRVPDANTYLNHGIYQYQYCNLILSTAPILPNKKPAGPADNSAGPVLTLSAA